MRKVYKNPKELATCLKDLVDVYLDGLMTYEELSKKIIILVDSNENEIYKSNTMSNKIANVIGKEAVEIINKIVEENNK